MNVIVSDKSNIALTDVQNVPIDRAVDTHKLLILVVSHLNWCGISAYNYFSAAPSIVLLQTYLIEMAIFYVFTDA